jgi:hypothetical protein
VAGDAEISIGSRGLPARPERARIRRRAGRGGVFNASSLRTQGPQRERNCAHRGGEDFRFGTVAEGFFPFEVRGYGSLRSQGRRKLMTIGVISGRFGGFEGQIARTA